jgi:hypothetical protein
MTELSLPSGDDRKNCSGFLGKNTRYWPTCPEGEERQRQEVGEVYRLYFSHPAVAAITWWDLSDQGSYADGELPMGLLRYDMSPKPAYDELMRLVKGEWWTTTSESVRSDGTAHFRGYYGTYRVTVRVENKVYEGQFEMPAKHGPHQTIEIQLTKI